MTAVLFTCAGQRVDIVTAFGRAGATTIAVDANELAPALYHADRRALVPRVDEPGYLDALRELIALHDVRLVVPLTDLDGALLARADLTPAVALVSPPDVIEAVDDKWLAHELFVARGIPSPDTWLPTDVADDVPFPVLVKARRGFGSRHIYRAETSHQLDFFLHFTPVPSMVQKLCAGEEFSIDIFSDLDGRCLGAVPRTMIESKGGESIKGKTIKDWDLIEFGAFVAETLGIRGPANIQCFRDGDAKWVTDVNPRFGGGFPLPTAAGSRYPELAVALANGERPDPRLGEFREGIVMTRFFSQVVLHDVGGTVELLDALVVPEEA
ncbi:MAG TPA: ATP-grasp domain-containing protein [Gaiellaceae bacterium]